MTERPRIIPGPATRADGLPVNATRRSGYVTKAMCRQHGCYALALEALNATHAEPEAEPETETVVVQLRRKGKG